jgi:hypothetical protein
MNRNPIFLKVQKKQGSINPIRHVLCPCYDKCLDEAVVKNQNFACHACPFKQQGIKQYIIHDGTQD